MERRVFIASLGSMVVAPPVLASKLASLPQTNVDIYLSMSEFLVGVDKDQLSPAVQPDDRPMEKEFYALVESAFGSNNITALLDKYAAEKKNNTPDDAIADAILKKGSPPVWSAMSRLTMKLWLFGVWFGLQERDTIVNKDEYANDMVVSGRAYTNGLAWQFAQAHPMGYSNFAFGSWASKPPPLL